MKKLLLTALVLIGSLTLTYSIEAQSNNASQFTVCDQRLAKALSDVTIKNDQIAARDQTIQKQDTRIVKSDERQTALLGAIAEYAEIDPDDKEAKKSWGKKVKRLVGDILKTATSPEVIRLATLIILARQTRN